METRFKQDKAQDEDLQIEAIASALSMPIPEARAILLKLAEQSAQGRADFLWAMRQSARNGWLTAEMLRSGDDLKTIGLEMIRRSYGVRIVPGIEVVN